MYQPTQHKDTVPYDITHHQSSPCPQYPGPGLLMPCDGCPPIGPRGPAGGGGGPRLGMLPGGGGMPPGGGGIPAPGSGGGIPLGGMPPGGIAPGSGGGIPPGPLGGIGGRPVKVTYKQHNLLQNRAN